jgi:WD40 repeat protein
MPFQFEHSTILSGHEDWVRSLAFRAKSADDTILILASGSQDTTIRLWKIECVEPDSRCEASWRLPGFDLLDVMPLNDISDESKSGGQVSLKRHLLVIRMEEK